jgi:inosine-uridine nucleoside N-ribohydrolase
MIGEKWPVEASAPRSRIIIDNDFSGDPDGLVQLAHHLLSPSVEIRAIIASHLRADDTHWNRFPSSVEVAEQRAMQVVSLCGKQGAVRVLRGAEGPMSASGVPVESPGVDFIVSEALRDDTDLPLFVVCGGSLTQVASAYLREPRIAERLTVLWIGGGEYPGEFVPAGVTTDEYNFAEDRIAAMEVFNRSELKLWQIPRIAYRQAIMSRAEILTRIAPKGPLGGYLADALTSTVLDFERISHLGGETYLMGDSPLVLLTALQTTFEADTGSSRHRQVACPNLNPDGSYQSNSNGRTIRVYESIDTRLMFEDFFAKLELFAAGRR